jgi:hypothetical protein
VLEAKAETILQFIHGLRGSLHVTFEEGTCAARLHDLLKPRVAPENVLGFPSDRFEPSLINELHGDLLPAAPTIYREAE